MKNQIALPAAQLFFILHSSFLISMTIDEYILQHIDDEGDYLKALYRDTHIKLLYPRMASGHLQVMFI